MGIVSTKNLSFAYEGKTALQDMTFDIERGSVTALVGPNGAGKTTLLRCLVGLEIPLSGAVFMDGVDIGPDPRIMHRACGYLSDFFGLYQGMTTRQNLLYMADCHGITGKEAARRIDELAAMLSMEKIIDQDVRTLSRGNRQRLGIAIALIHNPPILVLDEPASGMDPEARINLSRIIRRLHMEKKTIIISSHILSELDDYCTDMLVLRDGKLHEHVRLGTLRQDKQFHLRVHIANNAAIHVDAIKDFAAAEEINIEGENILSWRASGDALWRHNLLRQMIAAGIPVYGFEAEEMKLQDAYLSIAERDKK